MELKLEKAYRHSFAQEFGSNDKDWYLDVYNVLVKVKRDNPDCFPWERVLSYSLNIHYSGHANMHGHHWSLSGFSDKMDRIMLEEIGASYKSYATRKSMMKDLEKIVARNKPVYYKRIDGRCVPFEYEMA